MRFILGRAGRLLPQLSKVRADSNTWFLELKASSLSTISLETHVVLTSSTIMSCRLHPGSDISHRGHHRDLIHDRGYNHGTRFMLRETAPCSCTPPP